MNMNDIVSKAGAGVHKVKAIKRVRPLDKSLNDGTPYSFNLLVFEVVDSADASQIDNELSILIPDPLNTKNPDERKALFACKMRSNEALAIAAQFGVTKKALPYRTGGPADISDAAAWCDKACDLIIASGREVWLSYLPKVDGHKAVTEWIRTEGGVEAAKARFDRGELRYPTAPAGTTGGAATGGAGGGDMSDVPF